MAVLRGGTVASLFDKRLVSFGCFDIGSYANGR
jgi:hypothetical protein